MTVEQLSQYKRINKVELYKECREIRERLKHSRDKNERENLLKRYVVLINELANYSPMYLLRSE